jgi:hypothetical protein
MKREEEEEEEEERPASGQPQEDHNSINFITQKRYKKYPTSPLQP